jgi:hypothetical protein
MVSVGLVPLPLLFVVLLRVIRVEEDEPGGARLIARVEPEPCKSGPSSRAPRFLFDPAAPLLLAVSPFPSPRSSSSDISMTLVVSAETPFCDAECEVET